MSNSFEISMVVPASPEVVYETWLSADGHTAMTGSPATASDKIGASFEAWGGYIQGRTLALEPGRRIIQAWRTMEFATTEGDSLLEVRLEPSDDGTRVTIHHSNLPPHGEQYEQGWKDNYFKPMQAYFAQ